MASRKNASQAQPLARAVKDLLLQLQQVQSAVVVSVAALRAQACEMDEDIALVLQRGVAERLHEQMERLEASLQRLARGKA